MTKVIGPLFSLSASGTYRGQFVFRTRAGATFVATLPSDLPARTAGQVAHAQNISDMSAAWSAESQPTRDIWIACALTMGKIGYQLWWEQWIIQGSSTGDNPISPC